MNKSEVEFIALAFKRIIEYTHSDKLTPEEKEKIPEEMEICSSCKISLTGHYVEFSIKDKKDRSLKSKGRVYRNWDIKIV